MTVNLRAARRVWDLPVRVAHVMLISCVAGAWLTREARQIDLHAVFGYVALGLVAFRIAWGFMGGGHARFASFAYSPRETLAYLASALRGTPSHFTGHNPAGSWSVFGLLALVAAAAVSGVVAIGGLYGDGPLPLALSHEAAASWLEWHELAAWALLAFAALHVAGVAWGSRVHCENLVASMVTGRKAVHDGDTADAPARTSIALALVFAAAAFGALYLGVLSPRDVERRMRAEAAVKASAQGGVWFKECSGCHLAYAPALLPMRSWQRTIDEQDRHFGEDLGLSPAIADRLLAQARGSPIPSWHAWKLANSVPATQTPLEISTTPHFRAAHAVLPDNAFRAPVSAGKHQCEACHLDAGSGIFHPRMIRMPKGRVGS
jgi:cytochrome b